MKLTKYLAYLTICFCLLISEAMAQRQPLQIQLKGVLNETQREVSPTEKLHSGDIVIWTVKIKNPNDFGILNAKLTFPLQQSFHLKLFDFGVVNKLFIDDVEVKQITEPRTGKRMLVLLNIAEGGSKEISFSTIYKPINQK